MARSPAPISTRLAGDAQPRHRQGRHPREAIASCDPAGRCRASSGHRVAGTPGWRADSTWSRISATGAVIAEHCPRQAGDGGRGDRPRPRSQRGPEQLRVDRAPPGPTPPRGTRQQGLRGRCPARPATPRATVQFLVARPTGQAASSCRSPPERRPRPPAPRREASSRSTSAVRDTIPGQSQGRRSFDSRICGCRLGCHGNVPLPGSGQPIPNQIRARQGDCNAELALLQSWAGRGRSRSHSHFTA